MTGDRWTLDDVARLLFPPAMMALCGALWLAACTHPLQEAQDANDRVTIAAGDTLHGIEQICDKTVRSLGPLCSGVDGSDTACYEGKRDRITAACDRAAAALQASEAATSAFRQAAKAGQAPNLGELGLNALSAWKEAQRAVVEMMAVIEEVRGE